MVLLKSEEQVPGDLLSLYKEPQATLGILGAWTGHWQHHLVPWTNLDKDG